MDIDAMVRAYMVAALWSSTLDDQGTPMDSRYGIDDIAPDSRKRMERDCRRFAKANADDLEAVGAESAGHDFWLTRNRHGAGFWDRGLGELGERLTRAAQLEGECNLYLGDDGKIHIGS